MPNFNDIFDTEALNAAIQGGARFPVFETEELLQNAPTVQAQYEDAVRSIGPITTTPDIPAEEDLFNFRWDAVQYRSNATWDQLIDSFDANAQRVESEEQFNELIGDRQLTYKPGLSIEALQNEIAAYDIDVLAEEYHRQGVSAPVAEFFAGVASWFTTPEGVITTGVGILAGAAAAPLYSKAALTAGTKIALGLGIAKGAAVETVLTAAPSMLVGKLATEATGQRQYTKWDAIAEVALAFVPGVAAGGLQARSAVKSALKDFEQGWAAAGNAADRLAQETQALRKDNEILELYNLLTSQGIDTTIDEVKRAAEVIGSTDPAQIIRTAARRPKGQRGVTETGQRASEEFVPADDPLREWQGPSPMEFNLPTKANLDGVDLDFDTTIDRVLFDIGSGDEALLDQFIADGIDKGVFAGDSAVLRGKILAAADDVVADTRQLSGLVNEAKTPVEKLSRVKLSKVLSKPHRVNGVTVLFKDASTKALYLVREGSKGIRQQARKALQNAGLTDRQIDAFAKQVADATKPDLDQAQSTIPSATITVDVQLNDALQFFPDVEKRFGKSSTFIAKVRDKSKKLLTTDKYRPLVDDFNNLLDSALPIRLEIEDDIVRAAYLAQEGTPEAKRLASQFFKDMGLVPQEVRDLTEDITQIVKDRINTPGRKSIAKITSSVTMKSLLIDQIPTNVSVQVASANGKNVLKDALAFSKLQEFPNTKLDVKSESPKEAGTGSQTAVFQREMAEQADLDATIESMPNKEQVRKTTTKLNDAGDALTRVLADGVCDLA